MIYLLLLLGAATVAIALLCYSWMQSTRASQQRIDAHNGRLLELLEEQNALLKKMSDQNGRA